MRFIYVMSESSRDAMLELGYRLIVSDAANFIWVFANKELSSNDPGFDFPHVFSDTIYFGTSCLLKSDGGTKL